jgi:hypothetical protein
MFQDGKPRQASPAAYLNGRRERAIAGERKSVYTCTRMTSIHATHIAPHPDSGPVLAKATLAAAARLGLRNRHVAAVIGSSEASVSRLQSGRGLDPSSKEGELALMLVRLYSSLDALGGGDEKKARNWLHAANDHLGGVPAERIRSVEGLVDVVQYLDAMRGRL